MVFLFSDLKLYDVQQYEGNLMRWMSLVMKIWSQQDYVHSNIV